MNDILLFFVNIQIAQSLYLPFSNDAARACLEQCVIRKRDMTPCLDSADANSHQHVNVLVTSGPLIPSLVKCLLYRLGDLITCDNG